MSEQVLQQILGEIKEMRSEQREFASKQEAFESKLDTFESTQEGLLAGQKELNQIVVAIRSNQETTNAKLDAVTMDVRRLEGNSNRIEKKLDEQSAVLRGDLRFLNHRVADLEMDVAEIKNR